MRVLERVSRDEGIETTAAALDLVARAADGSYRDALGLLDQLSTYAGGRVEVADVLELLGAVERETLFELVDLSRRRRRRRGLRAAAKTHAGRRRRPRAAHARAS